MSTASMLRILALAAFATVTGCSEPSSPETSAIEADTTEAAPAAVAARVDDQRIVNAETDDPGQWLAHGRTYEEQRRSPLTQINRETVGKLGVVWHRNLNTINKVEATPLVIDGVMYFTAPWNVTYALDAGSGEEIWTYDPEVPRASARNACCGIVSRGLAAYEGRIYIATFDGRLIALNAASGKPEWEVDTIIDRSRSYTITGAPRVGAGKVYIGNGGAEFGVRGYVTAYDAETGEQAWRFYTVPGDPSQPFEHPEMEQAAKTWKGGSWWEIGGGGTVWNSIVYDPDFNTVYLGVGNGSPWTRVIRSPGGGDNLFLSSIVALDADTGRMKWYYQTTPGDNWDYTAVQDMMLADVEVDGRIRKVLMQAPKNGFFYVLDRSNGELLRAHPYGTVTWATHVDMETGRPVENTDKAYVDNPQWILPGPLGAHNWQAMSWNPEKNLMYLPTQDIPFLYSMPEEYQKTGIYKR
ncbi:MAG: PQQ-dependent dehydrogenase, methanol/ethanol family, partial [Gammaproteobacteria bacterium]|nr:PQQ-dependent dehydrogenase, methanol/ethanol family [Gammaproteobacteria bacterium]